jgi:hypothetical protein
MDSLLAVSARTALLAIVACTSAAPPGPTALRTYDPDWFTGWYRNVSDTPGQPALWSLLATGLHAGQPRNAQLVQLRCAGEQLEVRLVRRGDVVAVRQLRCEPAAGGVLAAGWVDTKRVGKAHRVAAWTSLKLWCRADRSLFVARDTNGLALLAWIPWPFAHLHSVMGPYGTALQSSPAHTEGAIHEQTLGRYSPIGASRPAPPGPAEAQARVQRIRPVATSTAAESPRPDRKMSKTYELHVTADNRAAALEIQRRADYLRRDTR